MNNIPTNSDLFPTNQVSANTERCYKRQLHNFAEWMADSRDVHDMEAVSTADLLAYRQSNCYAKINYIVEHWTHLRRTNNYETTT